MRVSILVACLGITASSCSTLTTDPRFAVRPFGERVELLKTEPQKGPRSLPLPTRRTFRETTIAQGSGRDGYDSIRVFAAGKGYAVVAPSDTARAVGKGVRVPLQLSRSQIDGLLAAMQRDQVHRMKGGYSADLEDGNQGFVEVVMSEGRVYARLNNYFEPVAHTYDFCNKAIWPDVQRRLAGKSVLPRVDLQDEYYRVFKD